MKLVRTVVYLIPLFILMGAFSVIRFAKRQVNKPIKDKVSNSYT